MQIAPSSSKLYYLEGLRGVAALMVVAHHFMLAFYMAGYDNNIERVHSRFDQLYYASPLNVLTNGNFCVMVFFVLSGFVLSHKYLREKDFTILISASKRRFFRLFIPVGFTLFLSFILLRFSLYDHVAASKIAHSEPWFGALWPIDNSFKTFLEFFFVRVMFWGDSNYDTSMWTMSYELFGSFLVFGLLAATHLLTRKNLVFLAALVLLYIAGKHHYLGFVFGMMLFSVEQHSLKNNSPLLKWVVGPLLLLGGLLLGSFPSLAWVQYSFWEFVKNQDIINSFVLIHTLGAVMVVTAVIISPMFQKILSTRLFIFLGFISFSLYLIHPLIIGSFSAKMFVCFHEQWGYNKTGLIVFLLTLALTIVLAWLMSKTVDKFSLDITKKYLGSAAERGKAPVKRKKGGNK